MLEARGINVTFNPGTPLENTALRGLTVHIDDGEFVTVIGTNGAGKSTLLSAFAGDVQPEAGQILIDGTDVTRHSAPRRARQLGRVFQDPRIGTCETLTIRENLAIAAARIRPRGLRRGAPARAIADWQDRLAELGLGLENRLEDRVGLLSGGQRQALSLLMACLVPNRALLLDEHTAALDPGAAETVLRLTDTFAAEGQLTVLMVTHSMAQALRHGTRTIMMHEGEITVDLNAQDRADLGIKGLLDLFEKVRGQPVEDDAILLN